MRYGDNLLVALFSVVAFVLTASLSRRIARHRKLRGVRRAGVVALLITSFYFSLYANWTGIDATRDRYVKGYYYSDTTVEYKSLMAAEVAAGRAEADAITDDRLVENYQNDPRRVWTPRSVDASAFALRTAMVSTAASWAVFLAFAVMLVPETRTPKAVS